MRRFVVSAPVVLSVVGVVAVGMMIAGFLLGARSFASNLLAELAGIAISVVVAVVLVDTLAARERRRRWDGVRSYLLDAIHTHLVDLASHLLMLPLVSDFAVARGEWEALWLNLDRVSSSNREASQAIGRVADLAREAFSLRVQELAGDLEPDATLFIKLCEGVDSELVRVRDVLTPIVLQVADEPTLAELLFRLQETGKPLRRYLSAEVDVFKFLLRMACGTVCDVCAIGADLDAYINEAASGRESD